MKIFLPSSSSNVILNVRNAKIKQYFHNIRVDCIVINYFYMSTHKY